MNEVARAIEDDLARLEDKILQAQSSWSRWTGDEPCRLFLTNAAHDEFPNLRGRIRSLKAMDPDDASSRADHLSVVLDGVEAVRASVFEPFSEDNGTWDYWDCRGFYTYRRPDWD